MKKLILIVAAGTMMLFAVSCGKQKVEETAATAVTTTAAVTETETTSGDTSEFLEGYGVIYGTIEEGTLESDTIKLTTKGGKKLEIKTMEIGDIEVVSEVVPGTEVAIAYSGDFNGSDVSGIKLVTMLDQAELEISKVTGITTSNAMSSFQIETEDGQSMSFLKDNCEIEENALSQDSGDKVEVIYITSGDQVYFPLKISKAK